MITLIECWRVREREKEQPWSIDVCGLCIDWGGRRQYTCKVFDLKLVTSWYRDQTDEFVD
jgi:hypothetical protein